LFCLESRRISFQVRFATPSEVTMMLGFMRFFVLNALKTLYSARKDSVVIVLEYS